MKKNKIKYKIQNKNKKINRNTKHVAITEKKKLKFYPPVLLRNISGSQKKLFLRQCGLC